MTPRHLTPRHAPLGLVVLLGLAAAPATVSAQPSEVVEYYATDALGSLRVVFDAAGTVVARADYAPFAEVVETTGALPAPQFTGYPRDGEAGLDYAVARQYQPRHGRFTTVDPAFAGLFDPQGWNRYDYARNSPLTFVDPDGRQFRTGVTCPGDAGCPDQPRPQPPPADPVDPELMGWLGGLPHEAGYIGRKRVFTEFEPRGVDRFAGLAAAQEVLNAAEPVAETPPEAWLPQDSIGQTPGQDSPPSSTAADGPDVVLFGEVGASLVSPVGGGGVSGGVFVRGGRRGVGVGGFRQTAFPLWGLMAGVGAQVGIVWSGLGAFQGDAWSLAVSSSPLSPVFVTVYTRSDSWWPIGMGLGAAPNVPVPLKVGVSWGQTNTRIRCALGRC